MFYICSHAKNSMWKGECVMISVEFEKSGNFFQSPVMDFEVTQMVQRVLHIVAAMAGLAFALLYKFEDVLCRKIARILGMGAIDDECESHDRFAQTRRMNALESLDINLCGLFPLAQIRERFIPVQGRNLKRHAPARTAPVKPEYEPWLVWCTSVLMRVDAETAMETMQRGGHRPDKCKAWLPHQRTISKHPVAFLPRHNPCYL
jgi:hypothetical protein